MTVGSISARTGSTRACMITLLESIMKKIVQIQLI